MKLIFRFLLITALFIQVKGENSHILPFLLSTVIPGGGQLYNQKYLKASIYGAAEIGLIYGAYIQNARLKDSQDDLKLFNYDEESYEYKKLNHEIRVYKKERDTFIWLTAATILLSGGDAFVDSYFKDFKRDKFDNLDIVPQANGISLVYNF